MADILHDLPINVPARRVFEAVSTPAGLDAWWADQSSGSPQAGATYDLGFGPDDQWKAHVTRCAPDSDCELEFVNADDDWTGTRVGFHLEPRGDATWLRFSHTGWPSANEHYRISCNGWALYLRLLRRFLEHGETAARLSRFLLYTSTDPTTGGDLWLLPAEAGGKPVPLVQSNFEESEAHFAPDMKWVAYTSNVSGRPEIYVRPFNAAAPTASSAAIPISGHGGRLVRWTRNGSELVFENLDAGIMAVDLTIDASGLRVGTPKLLFTVPQGAYWDVTADGQKFLVTMPTIEGGLTPITVLLNWWAK